MRKTVYPVKGLYLLYVGASLQKVADGITIDQRFLRFFIVLLIPIKIFHNREVFFMISARSSDCTYGNWTEGPSQEFQSATDRQTNRVTGRWVTGSTTSILVGPRVKNSHPAPRLLL